MQELRDEDPRSLGENTLIHRIGRGGMGVVYLGRTAEGDPVAVKTLRGDYADRSEMHERFHRETLALGMVQNPGTAAFMGSSDPDEDPQWLAMEYITGLNLSSYVKREGPLAEVVGTGLFFLLAEALEAIHRAGLLHRDLKPSNIMLGPDGPKVVDFGLVAIGGAGSDLTSVGAPMGTIFTMAPEQFLGADDVTAAADAYALGVAAGYALTGVYPYTGKRSQEIRKNILDPAVEPALDGAPQRLMPLLRGLLEVDPEQRLTLPELRGSLLEAIEAEGLTPGSARALVARRTHVAGTEVPDVVPAAPRTRVRSTRVETPAPEGTASNRANAVAERLRKAYARPPVAA